MYLDPFERQVICIRGSIKKEREDMQLYFAGTMQVHICSYSMRTLQIQWEKSQPRFLELPQSLDRIHVNLFMPLVHRQASQQSTD